MTRDQFLRIAEWKTGMEYTNFLRGVSADACVTMRTVDKALWQYSKVNQKG